MSVFWLRRKKEKKRNQQTTDFSKTYRRRRCRVQHQHEVLVEPARHDHWRASPQFLEPLVHDRRAAVVGRRRRVAAAHRAEDFLEERARFGRREAELLERAVSLEERGEKGEDDGAEDVCRERGGEGDEHRRGGDGGRRHW